MSTFYFVRHGEPDYDSVGDWNKIPLGKEFAGLSNTGVEQIIKTAIKLKEYSPDIIISSPYTRAMHGATIIARELNIPVFVEKDLHEWDSDRTHTVKNSDELLCLCKEFDYYSGIYPNGKERFWESRELVCRRVMGVLKKYLQYERVVVSGHAIMMQSITENYRAFEYGEIVRWEFPRKN